MIAQWLIEARRKFRLDGYATLADVGMDGDFVSPIQMKSASPTGPLLLAFHWSDVETVRSHYSVVRELGYLPDTTFNKVVDRALDLCRLTRGGVYITQAFHLLPHKGRSSKVPTQHIDCSFKAITRHELVGRKVIALGNAAADACRRNGFVPHRSEAHPSARGRDVEEKAIDLARALKSALG